MEKYIWLKAEHNYIAGSGKISRRVVVYKPKHRKRKKFKPPVVTSMLQSRRGFTGGSSDKGKNKIKFPNKAVKMVFLHWQRKKYPFTVHREQMNKTINDSFQRINVEIKGKGVNAANVMDTIDKCYELFKSDFFKYSHFFNSRKLTLSNFFRFPNSTHKKILKKVPNCPRSWYKECRKHSMQELMEKYSVYSKSKYGWANEKLKKIWMEYNSSKILSLQEKRKLGVVAKKIELLAMENWRNPFITGSLQRQDLPPKERWMLLIVNTIERMLITNKTYKPEHVGWLLTDHFYNKEIPKDIIRVNLYTKEKLDWKGIWE